MDAVTVAERTKLGLATFRVLRDLGVMGARLGGAEPSGEGTQMIDMADGEPIFVRFALSGEAAGYVDLALQPWLGDPVLAVALEADAVALGFRWTRWASYGAGEVALDCGDVLLAPYRGHGGALYKVPRDESKRSWGLSEERQGANRQRYRAYVQAIEAGSTPGPVTSPQPLPLCPPSSVAASATPCVPAISQRFGVWCVPAVLEMSIEYFLAENQACKYQSMLADSLKLLSSGSGLGSKDWNKIPQAVSDASGSKISCDLESVQWDTAVTEIDGARPLAYINDNHAFLIFGYSEVTKWGFIPPIGNISLVDPSGAQVIPVRSFVSLPNGAMVRFQGSQRSATRPVQDFSWLARAGRALRAYFREHFSRRKAEALHENR
jgi:hypothetical protein